MNDNNSLINCYTQLTSAVQDYYKCLDDCACCFNCKSAEEAWIKCYKAFGKNSNRNDEDLAKVLDHYLRAWGMYRNSFINNRPEVHLPAIRIIRNGNYWNLKEIN